MSYISFDTETTGLPLNNCKDYKNLKGFSSCRLVSIAVVSYSEDHQELDSWHYLIKPEGFQVTATEIHGITHEMAVENGKSFSEVYSHLFRIFSQSPLVIAYNIQFDLNVLKSEIFRRDLNMLPEKYVPFCVCKMAKNMNGGRSIRLGAVYKNLVGHELVGWHGALADARACAIVYKLILDQRPAEHKELGIRKIILKASEVAACIGKNPYKNRGDVMDELWKKYSPSTFTGVTKTDRALKLLESSSEAQEALVTAISTRADQSTDTQVIVKEATEKIQANANLNMSQKRELVDHIRSSVYTTFGTRHEDRTSVKVEQVEGTKLVKDDSFYELNVATLCGTKYTVVGKIDRIEEHADGSRVLIEIKNRTRGLFNSVRPYEMIQVQTYLQMLGLDNARLIEQYQDEVSSQAVAKDQFMWDNTVQPKLVEFCNELHSKMSV